MENNSFIVNKSHGCIDKLINKKYAIDCTCGNGHDTLYLAQRFEKVFAIDIQPLAIKRAKERLKNYDNVIFFLDNFTNMENLVSDYVDCVIFNLGFLPGSDRKITTKKEDTLKALIQAITMINYEGSILICCYLKHEGGKDEYDTIIDYIDDNTHLYITTYKEDNGTDVLIEIRKK